MGGMTKLIYSESNYNYMIDDFEKHLKSVKKRNGDKLLPKSIEMYVYYISQYEKDFQEKDGEELLEVMNKFLKQKNNIVIYSAFKNFMYYRGVERDSELSRKLLRPQKSATAMSSIRFLQSKVLSKSELRMIYDTVDDETKLIVSFLYDGGLRRNELLNVKFKDIEYVDKNKDKTNIYAKVRVLGKGNISRTIFLTKITVDLLKKLRPEQEPEEKVFVFLDSKGEPVVKQDDKLCRIIKKVGKDVLGRSCHPHMLRHSKASALCEAGGDVVGIQNYLNHKNINTTMVYIHASELMGRRTFIEHSDDISGEKI